MSIGIRFSDGFKQDAVAQLVEHYERNLIARHAFLEPIDPYKPRLILDKPYTLKIAEGNHCAATHY